MTSWLSAETCFEAQTNCVLGVASLSFSLPLQISGHGQLRRGQLTTPHRKARASCCECFGRKRLVAGWIALRSIHGHAGSGVPTPLSCGGYGRVFVAMFQACSWKSRRLATANCPWSAPMIFGFRGPGVWVLRLISSGLCLV